VVAEFYIKIEQIEKARPFHDEERYLIFFLFDIELYGMVGASNSSSQAGPQRKFEWN
jgi:hypothetical protein